MADQEKKPKKARFPNPEQARNKPAGIPKSALRQGQYQTEYLEGLERTRGLPRHGVDEPHINRAVPGMEQPPIPRTPAEQAWLLGPDNPNLNAFNHLNPFEPPDLGADMNPFSGGGAGTIEVPPPNQNTARVLGFDPLPPGVDPMTGELIDFGPKPDLPFGWDAADIPLKRAQSHWDAMSANHLRNLIPTGNFRTSSPEPDLTIIHPEAREGLVPNRRVFPQGIPTVSNEQMIAGLPVAQQARPTQHLTDYPSHLPRSVGIPISPAVATAADLAGIPTNRGGLLGAFALPVANTLGEMYAPIETQALHQALGQTQNQLDNLMMFNPVLAPAVLANQYAQAAQANLMNQVQPVIQQGQDMLLQVMGSPVMNRAGANNPLYRGLDPMPQIQMPSWVPSGQGMGEGAGRARSRKKAKR